MHEAVALLRAAVDTEDPADVFDVTQRSIDSATRVIMRADDSSGIIGDAIRDLLAMHPAAAARAAVPHRRLVDWMIRFQFDNPCDYFTLDPVAYAPALGDRGVADYRGRLDEQRELLGQEPPRDEYWSSPNAFEWRILERNEQRLAVLDRDADAIIRTHARDRSVAAWLEDTAKALQEIGETDLAIDWCKQAVDHDRGFQSRRAADRWCRLLAEHRPAELRAARLEVFRRWPSSSTATHLYRDAGDSWPDYRHEVMQRLSASPRDAVLFALTTLEDTAHAWALAHDLDLDDASVWDELAKVYEQIDPAAVVPVHAMLVDRELSNSGAEHYRSAARRLATMRKLAASTGSAAEVDLRIADLRKANRRRPRLQQEFDRAGLP